MERVLSPIPADLRPLVTPIGGESFERVRAFLQRDLESNLFMLSWLENYGLTAPGRPELFTWSALRYGDELAGVSLVINERLFLLYTPFTHDAMTFASYHATLPFVLEHVVSEQRSVEAFWEVYRRRAGTPRLRRRQAFMTLPRNRFDVGDDDSCDLRLANPEDLDAIFLASAAMHAEETLEDPLDKDATLFRRHIDQRISGGRTFVWFDDRKRLLFKADISARCGFGAQLSGVYTPPALRGQGFGKRGVAKLCETLFRQGFPLLTLYVNDDNEVARAIYERAGFDFHTAYHTIFVS